MNIENKNQPMEKKTRKSQADKIKNYQEAFKEIVSVYDNSELTDIQALRKIRKIAKEQLEG